MPLQPLAAAYAELARIEDAFMAAHEMCYMVSPATLLQAVKPGDKVRFTIDVDKRVIVGVARLVE